MGQRVAVGRQEPLLAQDVLAKVQRFRGSVYLKDGAIQPWQLTADGRHEVESDWSSWHLVVLDQDNQVCGCTRYLEHSNATTFSKLGVSRCPLAQSDEWGSKLQSAVESELAYSRKQGLPYVELGGWALAEHIRGTAEAVRMVLGIYGLAQELGGVVGVSTVTKRHCSSSILRRMGGGSLQFDGSELPSYYDPQYHCEMEVLRFYSWAPNPRYKIWIDDMKAELRSTPVLNLSSQVN